MASRRGGEEGTAKRGGETRCLEGENRGREEKERRVFDYFIDGFQLLVDPR
jgi:hypothetical protein